MSGLTKKEIQEKLKVFFDNYADQYKIEAAFLFGSYSPRGFIKKESDVDVAAVFDSSAAEEMRIGDSLRFIAGEMREFDKEFLNEFIGKLWTYKAGE